MISYLLVKLKSSGNLNLKIRVLEKFIRNFLTSSKIDEMIENDQHIDYSSNPITSPGPQISLLDSTIRLRKLGVLGGGTYGRVYQATEIGPGYLLNNFFNLGHSKNPTLNRFDPNTFTINPNSSLNLPGQMLPVVNNNIQTNENDNIVAVKRNFISSNLDESIGSLRELDILNLVRHHPYCIKTKSVSFGQPFAEGILSPDKQNQTSDKVFFVLEKGQMDGDRYLRSNPIPLVSERKKFALQILLAVEFLHSRGVYHRDLKPANIICFLSNGNLTDAKLTDFGMSDYYCSQQISQAGFVTLWYRAPEISLHKEYDYKVDVWSLGCILFELFSGNNLQFIRPVNDESLINSLIEKIPFPKEDYLLAQQHYSRKITRFYDKCQSVLPMMGELLGCSESQISQFNCPKLMGQDNPGTFDELIQMLNGLLMVNPDKRWSVTDALNSSFFDGYREQIDFQRTRFGINFEGQWILKPNFIYNYLSSPVRQRGIKWLQFIYSYRSSPPICNWYTHRIFFHVLEMFDRFLYLTEPSNSTPESDLVIWINTLFFVVSKYFRLLVQDFGLNYYAIGIRPEEFGIFRERVHLFEEYLIRDVFKLEIYKPTIYEISPEYLTETAIVTLINLFCNENIPSGLSLESIWSMCSDYLTQANQLSTNVNTSPTPIVSLIENQ